MNVADLISRKRDGQTLAGGEIDRLVQGYSDGSIPDYQMSAFAMAVFFQGMSLEEITCLTRAMIQSGDRLSWPKCPPVVDKHSTGGIGDKISIPLAPMLACCDVQVPMISGRGLGATGGTLDKLESIPGYRCELSNEEFRSIVQDVGCSIAGASARLAPADKRLYALRDVTGTVPSIPLITASILSKKIAEGIQSLILDVKWGSGAFMKTYEQAKELAKSLVSVGNKLNVKTSAVISDMNQPLGKMIGNAVEVDESMEILAGGGPQDVIDLTLELGANLLMSVGRTTNLDDGRDQLTQAIDSGQALDKFSEMVQRHGGNLDTPRRRGKLKTIPAARSGFVQSIDGYQLGMAIVEMGGGRKILADELDHSAGIEFLVRIGQQVETGEPVANLFCDSKVEMIEPIIGSALEIGDAPVKPRPLIVETIS